MNNIEVTAFYGENVYVPTYEQAEAAALRMSMEKHCQCFCFLNDMPIGETIFEGFEPLPGGGIREKYAFREVKPSLQDALAALYPEMMRQE